MFAGTLGRSQFFVRSSLLGLAETAVLLTCVAVQHEAFFGPPGQGRYRLAATAFLVGAFFGYKRISYAIRRNRDAGGGELLAGIYLIVTCTALAYQGELPAVPVSVADVLGSAFGVALASADCADVPPALTAATL